MEREHLLPPFGKSSTSTSITDDYPTIIHTSSGSIGVPAGRWLLHTLSKLAVVQLCSYIDAEHSEFSSQNKRPIRRPNRSRSRSDILMQDRNNAYMRKDGARCETSFDTDARCHDLDTWMSSPRKPWMTRPEARSARSSGNSNRRGLDYEECESPKRDKECDKGLLHTHFCLSSDKVHLTTDLRLC